MRQWRVGSFSMGILLISTGIVLWLAKLLDWDLETIASLFIPFLLLLIGIEIIVQLIFFRHDQALIKYDIFSILFISFITFLALVTFVMSSTGLLAAVQHEIFAQEQERLVATYNEPVDQAISKIVIEGNNNIDMSLNANQTDELTVFGTVQTNANDFVDQQDYLNINQVGDTLYLHVLNPTSQYGMGRTYHHYNLTVSIPGHLEVTANTFISTVDLDLEKISANWYVDEAIDVFIHEAEEANHVLTVSTDYYDNLTNWDEADLSADEEKMTWTKTFGSGDYNILIKEAHYVDERMN
ncbi:hypothetical protein ACS127_13105 [Amphibacillus sp. Q70]|uniref:hypothetical protein n=1 Tax=Amphibacillus sp. Q70 TaxID=3453416 RepID=UPI003F84BC41